MQRVIGYGDNHEKTGLTEEKGLLSGTTMNNREPIDGHWVSGNN